MDNAYAPEDAAKWPLTRARYLTRWQIVQFGAGDFRLTGAVYGDPRAPHEGARVRTSMIDAHGTFGDTHYVRTVSGSIYQLSPQPLDRDAVVRRI